MFSQRSFQSSSTKTTQLSGAAAVQQQQLNTSGSAGDKLNGAGTNSFKKRNWLRSSFSRAFSRKHPQANGSGSDAVKSLSSDKKQCLSDVDENELNAAKLDGSMSQRFIDFDDCPSSHSGRYGGHNGYGGEFSLPSSPLHQPIIQNPNSSQNM